jgi:uncharacterized membrane protein YfcA
MAGGHVIWVVAASMAVGQLIGAWLGSHLVLKHGAVLVRPILVVSSILVSLKLVWDQLNGA